MWIQGHFLSLLPPPCVTELRDPLLLCPQVNLCLVLGCLASCQLILKGKAGIVCLNVTYVSFATSTHLDIYFRHLLLWLLVLIYSPLLLILNSDSTSASPKQVRAPHFCTAKLQNCFSPIRIKQSVWDIQGTRSSVILPFIGKGWDHMYICVL